MEVVAGHHVFLEGVPVTRLGPLSIVVVQPVQEVGDPGHLHLDGPHLKLRVTLEHATEDHVGEGHPDPVVNVSVSGGAYFLGVQEGVVGACTIRRYV